MEPEEREQLAQKVRMESAEYAMALMDATDENLMERLELLVRAILAVREHFDACDIAHTHVRGYVLSVVLSVLDD